MPVFETPEAISASIDLAVGDVRLDAGDRVDTVVEVRPTDPDSDADTKAAENTRVEYADGRLVVRGPRQRSLFGRAGSIDVSIGLPSGSQVRAVAHSAAFRCAGRLGDCQLRTSTGDLRVQETGPLIAATSQGDVSADLATGQVEVTTGSGAVRVGLVEGTAVIKNSNGDSWVREVTGDLRVRAANGDISIGTAHASVEARTANGDVRVGEVVRGSVVLGTTSGQLAIGIRAGTAALLDVRTKAGDVHNFMTPTEGPGEATEQVEVRASTARGDIVIRRV
ncbi:DUF4097 family beta strand repeat-containing protein [Streptomyces aurantiogriseus]|uniref:DUF4097 domain-containing protein n=1 Tax=Streptomyces aurantiogriseus TaxID=66870 RepID=A0A918FM14_9ACTN|nr:DUF4097 family beta strand repeat-containing protein [Streptomyces aurantiogriseus]GGR52194.1 hypothetical protein GCM10010251_81660 [Streptomyces aurantiogriseus]